MLDRLEQAGLLARKPNTSDRRSYLIEATAEGQLRAGEIRDKLERLEAEVASRLTEQDIAGFRAVMAAVGDVTQVVLRGAESPAPRAVKQEGGA
jgi:DNA-binding MarR family transcriptional regulator